MRRFSNLFAFLTMVSALNAQVTDTVSLGAGITNQAYYNLLDGAEENDVKSDWDIAFQTDGAFSTSILINEAAGTELYIYPGDTSDWVSLDTAGMKSNWTRSYNSDVSWDTGAFSHNQTLVFVGWGTYNTVTHHIIGDKLFVLKLSNGDYQKIWIKNLIGGKYNFRHATLNNSMDMMHAVDKNSFTGKNFAYFSLQTHSVKDKEPLAENWDLFFGQYTAFVPTPYLVTGVLNSSQTEAVKVYPVNDPSTYIDWQSQTLNTDINIIGYDWKSYNMSAMKYEIADSTVYFVKNQHGDVFKLVFEDFGGSATGDIVFNKTHIHFSGIENSQEDTGFEVYPNPASDVVNIVYNSNERSVFQVLDRNGRTVSQVYLSSSSWNHQFSVSNLPSGLYILRMVGETTAYTKKLLVK